MKKLLHLFAIALIALSLAACSNSAGSSGDDQKTGEQTPGEQTPNGQESEGDDTTQDLFKPVTSLKDLGDSHWYITRSFSTKDEISSQGFGSGVTFFSGTYQYSFLPYDNVGRIEASFKIEGTDNDLISDYRQGLNQYFPDGTFTWSVKDNKVTIEVTFDDLEETETTLTGVLKDSVLKITYPKTIVQFLNIGDGSKDVTFDFEPCYIESYDGLLLANNLVPGDFEEIKKQLEYNEKDYSIDGRTIIITDTGLQKSLDNYKSVLEEEYEGVEIKKLYLLPLEVEGKRRIVTIADFALEKLEEETDYTITHNGFVVELTAAGVEKYWHNVPDNGETNENEKENSEGGNGGNGEGSEEQNQDPPEPPSVYAQQVASLDDIGDTIWYVNETFAGGSGSYFNDVFPDATSFKRRYQYNFLPNGQGNITYLSYYNEFEFENPGLEATNRGPYYQNSQAYFPNGTFTWEVYDDELIITAYFETSYYCLPINDQGECKPITMTAVIRSDSNLLINYLDITYPSEMAILGIGNAESSTLSFAQYQHIYYDGILISDSYTIDKIESNFADYQEDEFEMKTPVSYELTDFGLVKYLGSYYLIVYNGNYVTTADNEFISDIGFQPDTHYTLTHNNLVMELTEAGYTRYNRWLQQ